MPSSSPWMWSGRARWMVCYLVITGEDISELGPVANGPILDMLLLATGKVRYVGEPVAVVIGVTEEAAQEGADLVEVSYEPLRHLLDPEVAMRSDAPLIHEGLDGVEGNVCWRQATRAGDIETALAEADLVISRRLVTSKAHAMPMETHAAVARYDDLSGTITLWTGTQQPHLLRNEIARVFGLPPEQGPRHQAVHGGSVRSQGRSPYQRGHGNLGRPCACEDRSASSSAGPRSSRRRSAATLTSGTPRSQYAATGRYSAGRRRSPRTSGPIPISAQRCLRCPSGSRSVPTRLPALDIEGAVVYTNKPPSGAFRGFGNPQATFAREVMFDIAARELGIDPLEFRYRNLIRSEDLPTSTANGLKLLTLPIEEATDAVAEAIGYEAMRASKPPWRGVGIANMLEWGGGCRWHVNYDVDMSSVTVAMNADGSVT